MFRGPEQSQLMLPAHFHDVTCDHIWSKILQTLDWNNKLIAIQHVTITLNFRCNASQPIGYTGKIGE